jgi:hypothetical protein
VIGPVEPSTDWVALLERAGIVAGALIPLSLVFRTVRQWAYRHLWLPIRELRVTKQDVAKQVNAQLSVVLEKLQMLVDASTQAQESRERQERTLLELAGSLKMTKSILWQLADHDQVRGWYECDVNGAVLRGSRTLLAWLRCAPNDIAGSGWVNFVAEQDKDRAQQAWADAVRRHSSLYIRLRMGPMGGPYIEYEAYTQPIPEAPPPLGFSGWIRPVQSDSRDPRVTRAFPEPRWPEDV